MIERFDGPASVLFTGAFARGRETVILLDDLAFGSYVVRAGARSDGCSTPWWGWWFAPPLGREARAGFYHDDMLTNRGHGYSRREIDRRFRESMRCLGTPLWKRNIMWLAVRWQAFRTGDR